MADSTADIIMPVEPAMWTVEQFAEHFQLKRSTAYEAVQLGKVPGVVRIGKHWRLNRKTVLAWSQGEVRVSRKRRRKA